MLMSPSTLDATSWVTKCQVALLAVMLSSECLAQLPHVYDLTWFSAPTDPANGEAIPNYYSAKLQPNVGQRLEFGAICV